MMLQSMLTPLPTPLRRIFQLLLIFLGIHRWINPRPWLEPSDFSLVKRGIRKQEIVTATYEFYRMPCIKPIRLKVEEEKKSLMASGSVQAAFWREVSGHWLRSLRLCHPHITLLADLETCGSSFEHHAVLFHGVTSYGPSLV